MAKLVSQARSARIESSESDDEGQTAAETVPVKEEEDDVCLQAVS